MSNLELSIFSQQNCITNANFWEKKDDSNFFNYNLAFFCLFSLFSNSACSSILCTMSLKIVILCKDGFILLMYKIWGRTKLQTNFTNRVYVPLRRAKDTTNRRRRKINHEPFEMKFTATLAILVLGTTRVVLEKRVHREYFKLYYISSLKFSRDKSRKK